MAAVVGVVLAGTSANAITNWLVGINAGSSGEGQAGTVQNLTITATATPAAGNLLFPGGNGDVVISIANPNAFQVSITGVTLPTSTTYADGYTLSDLATLKTGCAAAVSTVAWAYASNASVHTLTTALTVGASGQGSNPLVVTLTNVAVMGLTAPTLCQSAFFKMPSLSAIAASAGSATSTTMPATSGWTS